MFYVLKLDTNTYLAHHEDEGWITTDDIHSAERLSQSYAETFIKEYQKNGFVYAEGNEYTNIELFTVEIPLQKRVFPLGFR